MASPSDSDGHLAKALQTKLSMQAHFQLDVGGQSLVVRDLIETLSLYVYTMMLIRKGLSASKSVFRSESFVAAA